MRRLIVTLLPVFLLTGCYEGTVTERRVHRRYVQYVPDQEYYRVYYRDRDQRRPYPRRVSYDDDPATYRVDRTRRFYRAPYDRTTVAFRF